MHAHNQTMTPKPTDSKAIAVPTNPALTNEGGPETTRPAAPFAVAEPAAPEVAVPVPVLVLALCVVLAVFVAVEL